MKPFFASYIILIGFLKLNALDLNLIKTLSITNDLKIIYNPNILNSASIITRKDGVFLFQSIANYGNISVIILTNGQSLVRPSLVQTISQKTNILQSFFEDGELKIIQEEQSSFVMTKSRPDLVLKTISDTCFFDHTYIISNINANIFKISSKSKVLITNSIINNKNGVFSKIFLNGKQSENLTIPNWDNYSIGGERYNYQSENYIDVANKNVIIAKQDGDKLSFYRLTDPDLLSSPNRITLGSSQNGSLTATVNNPEQALLNIQSSTNLFDWNTFKTIKNEPSLEIVVPANKPKEFIRAIE